MVVGEQLVYDVLLSLTLGIAANTVIFTFVKAVTVRCRCCMVIA